MSVDQAGGSRDWRRAHIVTPFINGLQGLFVVLISVMAAIGQEGRDGAEGGLIILVLLTVGGVLLIGVAFLSWRFNEYRLGDDAVYHRKGFLFKSHRQARLDRLQAVDVVQPLLARVFGFAETKIEVAGGMGSAIAIKYLKVEEAYELRNEVLALAAGLRGAGVPGLPAISQGVPAPSLPPPDPDSIIEAAAPTSVGASSAPVPRLELRFPAPVAPERQIYAVPFRRLVGSILMSWTCLFVVVFGGLLGYFSLWAADLDSTGSDTGGGAGAVMGFLGVGAVLWAQLAANASFTAGIAADGIRLSHGLLETRHQTVPPGRIQALTIKQSLLWRRQDWWKVTLNVAGYGNQQEAVSTLLPVGSRQQALDALWLVLPDLGDPDPTGTISTAMRGKGSENGFTPCPARSWIFDPFQWRRRGVRATDRALLIRKGLFVREFFVVPHERTQSLALIQGPLQRRLRVATIEVHSTRGVVRPIAKHLDVNDAVALLDDQARRAREGRKRQTPEQWMEAVAR